MWGRMLATGYLLFALQCEYVQIHCGIDSHELNCIISTN